jgi:sec-independent protein translocase protein TatB
MHGQLSLQFMVIAPTVQIANLGMADSLILMVMALVVFGPRRLPQIGRQIGKLMYEFRKASNDFKFQMEEELRNSEEADRRKKEEERLRALALAAPAPAAVDPQVPALGSGAPETTATSASESSTVASETAAGDMPNPAAGYDNGPVASTQVASTKAADVAPTIRPPSKGEIIAAAQGWSFKQQQAKAAEAAVASESAPIEGATNDAPPTSTEVALEVPSSEVASSEPTPEAAAQAASFPVNHHG